ncbi:mitochondrial import inner membrane translocase subunit PAM16 like 2-like [Hibiscus syriacus]|uniref:mitochondrial import inner membrane translocase subunit PAM16 like 2-like n=1 Tax=Hibiscus syriacus TaxID=106335 RepID=UPI001921CC96|nr:mitochondrial import inner membrane translocase subunit PAM16 like 2-like [Hibiscus syriacus]
MRSAKSGVTHETLQNAARRAGKVMAEQEARQILGVSENSTWEEIIKKYDHLFEKNAKVGSFYLQSKVHRAIEPKEKALLLVENSTRFTRFTYSCLFVN